MIPVLLIIISTLTIVLLFVLSYTDLQRARGHRKGGMNDAKYVNGANKGRAISELIFDSALALDIFEYSNDHKDVVGNSY